MTMSNIPTGRVLSADTLKGEQVVDATGEHLGTLEDLTIDLDRGRIAYAVLSVGGLSEPGDRLFAIPWNAVQVDTIEMRLVLNVRKERLKTAPAFAKDRWPDFADRTWGANVHQYYGTRPFWQ